MDEKNNTMTQEEKIKEIQEYMTNSILGAVQNMYLEFDYSSWMHHESKYGFTEDRREAEKKFIEQAITTELNRRMEEVMKLVEKYENQVTIAKQKYKEDDESYQKSGDRKAWEKAAEGDNWLRLCAAGWDECIRSFKQDLKSLIKGEEVGE